MAQATSAAPLTNAAIRLPSRFSSSPTSVPVIMVIVTRTAAKITVVRSDSQNSGSRSVVVKLLNPAQCPAGADDLRLAEVLERVQPHLQRAAR